MKERLKDILLNGKSGERGGKEEREMLALFHQPEREFELKDALLKDLDTLETQKSNSSDFGIMFAKLWEKLEPNSRSDSSNTKVLYPLLRIAAVLIIGLFIGFTINTLLNKPESAYYHAHSPKGSILDLTLPDGSIIFLNADSRIKYSINGNNGVREVFLDGEAWFQVEKMQGRPFIVHTPYYDVNVTGTKFNVKAYNADREILTTLEEGEVKITSTKDYKFVGDITLKPGEQIVLNKDSRKLNIKEVNTSRYTSWKENKLIFVNLSLQDLVVMLERRYGVDIEVKDESLLDLHFDGTIKNESIIEILEIIKSALQIDYRIVDQKVEITNPK